MNIAIIGNDVAVNEVKSRLGESHQYSQLPIITKVIFENPCDVIFDFNSEWNSEAISTYLKITVPVFVNISLSTLSQNPIQTKGPLIGFCGLPTFFIRPKIEVVVSKSHESELKNIGAALGFEYVIVKDELGMVTPRVIAMIINEAFEAVKDGVASREDIDLSMKLGTNYPYGPFEWAEKIGLGNLKQFMNALFEATKDVRIKPNF